MALIVQGGLAATVSGKVGNTVFARNRGGAYIRNFAKPTNPSTPLQAAVRASFATGVNAWNTLSAGQQLGFASLAVAVPQPNRVGLTSVLPPLSMFQKINVGRIAAGLDIVADAPVGPLTDDWNPSAFAITEINATALTVHYDGSSAWVVSTPQDMLLIYLSPVQSTGKNFYKGKYNFFVGIGGTGAYLAGLPATIQNGGGGTSGNMEVDLVGTGLALGRYFYRAYVTRADGHTGPETTGQLDIT